MLRISRLREWLVCLLKGHDYPCPFFMRGVLCHCRRCGKEIAGRTLADVEPMTVEDEPWWDQ